jgi:hypothetical protein
MSANDKCGIYMILCSATGKRYIGRSVQIYRRWSQHKTYLRSARSASHLLQYEWSKYGEETFLFSILEECTRDVTEQREQFYLDSLKPELNISTRAIGGNKGIECPWLVEYNQKRRITITHCPRGHEYNERNTYLTKKGKRCCRACNALRVAATIAKQSPEQRQKARTKSMELFWAKWAERRAKQKQYSDANKVKKREYDKLYRERCKKVML